MVRFRRSDGAGGGEPTCTPDSVGGAAATSTDAPDTGSEQVKRFPSLPCIFRRYATSCGPVAAPAGSCHGSKP